MFNVGCLVALVCELTEGFNDAPIPAGTLGVVIGDLRGIPQIALAGFGIRLVPPHIVEPYRPVATQDEFTGIVAALLVENQTLARRLAEAVSFRPIMGNS